jgi:hypothetical protein
MAAVATLNHATENKKLATSFLTTFWREYNVLLFDHTEASTAEDEATVTVRCFFNEAFSVKLADIFLSYRNLNLVELPRVEVSHGRMIISYWISAAMLLKIPNEELKTKRTEVVEKPAPTPQYTSASSAGSWTLWK